MKGIPLFKEGSLLGKRGFTIDGVGYYARHLESHRLLYGKQGVFRPALAVAAFLMLAVGTVFNAPAVAFSGVFVLGVIAWTGRRQSTPRKESGPPPAA